MSDGKRKRVVARRPRQHVISPRRALPTVWTEYHRRAGMATVRSKYARIPLERSLFCGVFANFVSDARTRNSANRFRSYPSGARVLSQDRMAL